MCVCVWGGALRCVGWVVDACLEMPSDLLTFPLPLLESRSFVRSLARPYTGLQAERLRLDAVEAVRALIGIHTDYSTVVTRVVSDHNAHAMMPDVLPRSRVSARSRVCGNGVRVVRASGGGGEAQESSVEGRKAGSKDAGAGGDCTHSSLQPACSLFIVLCRPRAPPLPSLLRRLGMPRLGRIT